MSDSFTSSFGPSSKSKPARLSLSHASQKRTPVHISKTAKINGLRVYTNPLETEADGGHVVLYSRRADGPYYRWFYEEEASEWQAARVHFSLTALRELCAASWKIIPPELQRRICEHYLE